MRMPHLTGPIDDTVLVGTLTVVDPESQDLVVLLRHLLVHHRLRAPVSGAYLGNSSCYSWSEGDGFGFFTLDRHGRQHLVVETIDVVAASPDPIEATRAWCQDHDDYEAVEGYVVERKGEKEIVGAACWAWSPSSQDLIDPVRGRRGVPPGVAYVGIPAFMDIVRPEPIADVLDRPLSDLRLQVRVVNYLRMHSGIATVRELTAISRPDLRRLPGIGVVSACEVDAALADHGLYLPWATTRPTPTVERATDADRAEPITSLVLSPNATAALHAVGISTIGDLLDRTLADLLRLDGVGPKMTTEVRAKLRARGLALKVHRPEQPSPHRGDPLTPVERLCMRGVASDRLHRLYEIGVETVGDLSRRTAAELLTVPGIGSGTVNRIREALGELGFSLKDDDVA